MPRAGWVRVEHGVGPDALTSAQTTIGHSIKMGGTPRDVRVLVNGEHHPEVTNLVVSTVVSELRASGHMC